MPDRLNPAQQAAVHAVDGPVIIVAGPGTGKTTTFAHRITHLIQGLGVPPERILAVTFTRSAAAEMKDRLTGLLGVLPDGLWVETYHAAALRILREHGYPFGPGVEFSLIAEEDKPALLEGLVSRKDRPSFLDVIRQTKQRLEWPEDGPASEYQKRLVARRQLDFDDLFLYASRLFDERPEVTAGYRERFTHIIIDEFQDTSFAQYRFVTSLASDQTMRKPPPPLPSPVKGEGLRMCPSPLSDGILPICPSPRAGEGRVGGAFSTGGTANQTNLCVIGDPDQAIYGFAGNFRAFEAFKTDFPKHRVCRLSENYRSQGTIVQAATQVIAKSPAQLPRELTARLAAGLPIAIARHATDRQEAELIVRKIEALLGGSSHYTINSGWAQADDDAGAYGLADIAILYRVHAQARVIADALQRSGLPYRCFGKSSSSEDREDFIAGEQGPRADAISLMTLHRAKGLEFPVVFIAGCEEGLLPYERSEDHEEERRLFFVGMTRAKQRLFLSSAAKRFLYGETRWAAASPYLLDIHDELRQLGESPAPRKPPERETQQTLF
jgi:DNA helicase-2/ATP-dependent DNA helicase PcrA